MVEMTISQNAYILLSSIILIISVMLFLISRIDKNKKEIYKILQKLESRIEKLERIEINKNKIDPITKELEEKITELQAVYTHLYCLYEDLGLNPENIKKEIDKYLIPDKISLNSKEGKWKKIV